MQPLFNNIMCKKKVLLGIIGLLDKSRGRDKLFRLFQYAFRYFSEVLKSPGSTRALVAIETTTKYQRLFYDTGTTFARSRKVLRFFKHYALFERARGHGQRLATGQLRGRDAAFSSIRIVSETLFFLYLLTDHVLALNTLNLLRNKGFVDFNEWATDFVWLLMTAVDIAGLLIQISKSLEEKRHADCARQLLKVATNALDFAVS